MHLTALFMGLKAVKTDGSLKLKLLRIMKLTAIILLAACLTASAEGLSQQVNIQVKNASLESVFKELRKQTGYQFLYNNQMLDKAKKVSIHIRNGSLEEVLQICFEDQVLTYEIIDKTIVVKPKVFDSKQESRSVAPLINITGKVTDTDGNPLVGATVKIRGSNIMVSTDESGIFMLRGVGENAVLEISFAEHESLAIEVKNRTSIVVALKQEVSSLKEVVVNKGYYTEQQKLSTGNVSKVTSKEIEKQPVNNPLLALQGRVPGMEITQQNGLPGSGIRVQIRGQNSIEKGMLPLYVIDGVPYYSDNVRNLLGYILGSSGVSGSGGSGSGGTGDRGGNPLSYINPSDIESISVLKDADATAIYGSRGANGVVLITTKKGRPGKLKVDVNVQTGIGQVSRMLKLLNTQQYLQMRREAFANDLGTPSPNSDFDITFYDSTRFTDWQKELIGGTAKYNHGQLSLSGGNSYTSFLVSGTYHKETTVFPGDLSNKQGNLHLNVNSSSANQKLKLNFSTNYNVTDNRLIETDLTGIAVTLAPNAPALYNSDGTINWASDPSVGPYKTWVNPLAGNANKLKSLTKGLLTNTILSYQLFKSFEVRTSVGYNNWNTTESLIRPAISKDPAEWSFWGNNLRSARFNNSGRTSWIVEPQMEYKQKHFGGDFSFLMGGTIQHNKDEGRFINGEGFSSDLLIEDLNSAAIITNGGMFNSEYKYNAVFGRLGYNWGSKYLINLTARRDGSSRFGPDNRFHNFGAIGLGWVFSEEKYINKSLGFLSYGKLRASFGTTGNDGVGDYSYLDLYRSTGSGVPYQGTQGLQITQPFTPDLAWEETQKSEVGLEIGLFNDRINITASHYQNKSSNQLIGFPSPNTTGFLTITRNLDAVLKNVGWEFTLNTTNINSKNFRWVSSFNIFWNDNKLVKVDSGSVYQKYIGLPLNGYHYYKFAGVNSATGVYQFQDRNGQITENPNFITDKTVFFEFNPKFSGGLSNSIEFKNIQLDFHLHFVKQTGQDFLYAGYPGSYWEAIGNQPVTVLNRWQKPGDVTNIQRFNQDYSLYQGIEIAQQSDHSFKDLSFIKLRNVSISWQIPNDWKKIARLQNCKLYLQGQNLLTISNYNGFDPETKNYSSLPPLRVITAGIQVGL